MVEKSYVDVNVFVYWLGGHPVYGPRAREWIDAIARSPKGSFLTSSLTIYEVAVILAGLAGRGLGDVEFASKLAAAFGELKGLEIAQLEARDYVERARHAVTPPFVRGYRAPLCFLASSFAR